MENRKFKKIISLLLAAVCPLLPSKEAHMKKLTPIISIILAMCLMVSCGNNENICTSATTNSVVQAEARYEKFKSIDELIDYINTSSAISKDAQSSRMYYPEILIDGYELLSVTMNKYRVFYYYMPSEILEQDAECIFDYEKGFMVTLFTEDTEYDRMQALSNQLGIEISAEGTIYDEKNNNLFVPLNDTVYYITFPKNYMGEKTVNNVFEMKSTVIE